MLHKVIITLLKPLSFLPALLVMYMIFSFSAQTGTESGDLSFKVSVKLVEVGSEVLDMELTDSEIQMYANKYHHYVRKLGHMTEYCVLAITLCVPLYAYGVRGIWLYLLAGFICAGFAATDEYHQSFVAGRGPSVRDVCIDTFGALIGITGTQIVGRKEYERTGKRAETQKKAEKKNAETLIGKEEQQQNSKTDERKYQNKIELDVSLYYNKISDSDQAKSRFE